MSEQNPYQAPVLAPALANDRGLELLERISREMKTIRELVSKVVNYMVDAESEIPEKMRRFIMYMHDVHDVMNLYHEQGHEPPDYIKREVERCDDRYRQILTQLHTDGGAFEKVRAEMAGDKANRYDHTRLLTKSLRQDQDPQLNLSQPPAKE